MIERNQTEGSFSTPIQIPLLCLFILKPTRAEGNMAYLTMSVYTTNIGPCRVDINMLELCVQLSNKVVES